MRPSLQGRCEAQIRNEMALRKERKLEFEAVVKLAALMYANAGREVDAARLRECKQLLKDKVGMFSNFRGSLEYLVRVKMALSDDPAAYIDGVLGVYQLLKEGTKLPGEMMAMAATTIYENCAPEERDAVARKTREAFAKIKEQHRFLTGEDVMALVALMIMAGIDPSLAAARAEELYGLLKGSYLPGSDTPQSAALVLALSGKPAGQKVTEFLSLYEDCKAAGCATAKDKAMTVYAAFADLDADRAEIVAEIGEVDKWLKGKKGYGALGVGASMRRVFAATLVLEDRQSSIAATASSMASAVTQAVVEELVLVLISLIVTSIIVSAAAQSNN